MNGRVIAAVVLVAGATAAGLWLSRSPTLAPAHAPTNGEVEPTPGAVSSGDPVSGATTEETGFTSSKECAVCHEDVWREWESSFHAKAWTDPMVQALSNGFRMSECIDCHAPLPIHVTGVAQRVAPRKHDRQAGVDCISCHLLEDGVSVAATRTVDTSKTRGACRPVDVPAMRDASTCAGCHNQHETVLELETANIGKTCADCHMEPVARSKAGVTRTGKSHAIVGGHDVAMHRRAAQLDVSIADGYVVARVTNIGAGHQIPTDARHRSYNLFLSTWDERGNPQVVDLQMPDGEFRLYYRQDFKPTTQIAHGKFREAKWRIPEGIKGKVLVRLTYALNPEELAAKRLTEVAKTELEIR